MRARAVAPLVRAVLPLALVAAGVVLAACEAATEPLGPGLAVPDAGCTPELTATPLGVYAPEPAGLRPAGLTAALAAEGLYLAESSTSDGFPRLSRWTGGDYRDRIGGGVPGDQLLVLGAGEGAVAWGRIQASSRASHVLLAAAGTSTELAATASPLAIFTDAPPGRAVDGGRVAYLTEATLEVAGLELATPYATLLPFRPAGPPFLRWPSVALGGYDGRTRRIVVYDVAAGWRAAELEGEGLDSPVLADGALFYLAGGVPMRAPLGDTLVPARLFDGLCSSLDTDGERVVFACDPEPAAIGYGGLARHRALWLYERGALRALDLGGRRATYPRVRGDRVAYLAYEETDFCATPAAGRVVVQPLDGGPALDLGAVSHGCYCCDAYWPLPELHFEGDLVAWSYAMSDASRVGWGLARLGATCR